MVSSIDGCKPLDLDRIPPRLITAYDQGLLVPFIGAGMSRDACVSWGELVAGLERKSGAPKASDGSASTPASDDPVATPDQLVRRANSAMQRLRFREEPMHEAVRDVLYVSSHGNGQAKPPEQTKALAGIWWPLVLTTNYDHLFEHAYRSAQQAKWKQRLHGESGASMPRWMDIDVCGRSVPACQRVLTSLTATDATLLWALQGYLAAPAASDNNGRSIDSTFRRDELARELVIGHQEYRRVAHREQHFRRTFAEVFRRRSFLFLGSGLGEPYFQELFGEVLEFFGPNPHPHYAFMHEAEVEERRTDPGFLRARLNIVLHTYKAHDDLTTWLGKFAHTVGGERERSTSWGYRLQAVASPMKAAVHDDLTIVHGGLPERLGDLRKECLAVSAGFSSSEDVPHLSGRIRRAVQDIQNDVQGELAWSRVAGSTHLFEASPAPGNGSAPTVVAVRAWKSMHERDLRLIGDATYEALVHLEGKDHVRMSLLATGRSSHLHPRFSLVEMIRAYARFRRARESSLRLTIHVVDAPAAFEMTSGRLDVGELLTAEDVRFWVEILDRHGGVQRELVTAASEDRVEAWAEQYHIPEGWSVAVDPNPEADPTTYHVGARTAERRPPDSLRELGVIPGSTLRFNAPAERAVGDGRPVSPAMHVAIGAD